VELAAADDDGYLLRRVRHDQMSLTRTNLIYILRYCPVLTMLNEIHMLVEFIYYLPMRKSDFTHFQDSKTVKSYCEKLSFFTAFVNALIRQP